MLSVFRVPVMAIVTQLFYLSMKYGVVRSATFASLEAAAELQRRHFSISASLWDWFRCLVAFKMSAESLDTIFLSIDRFKFLSRPAFFISAIAALLSIVGALVYGYRLLLVRRDMKQRFGNERAQNPIDLRRVYAGVLYFNPSDPAMFVTKYIFNFANKWAWLFIACLLAYPLLVFWPT